MTHTVVHLLIFPSLGLLFLSQHFPFRELGQETQVEITMLWSHCSWCCCSKITAATVPMAHALLQRDLDTAPLTLGRLTCSQQSVLGETSCES